MRVLILSDIHGNIDALRAVHERVRRDHFDEIWVLGDLVDYGGAPLEVVEWVRASATRVVRGNHDHAMGTGDDCRSAPLYHDLAVATRAHFRSRLDAEILAYLSSLPLEDRVTLSPGGRAVLVHASPGDPLFGYVPTGGSDETWRNALRPASDVRLVFVGHTHDQFTRTVDGTLIVNPGSVGLPKDGDPRAAFAILDGESISLERTSYDTEQAASRLSTLSLSWDQHHRLSTLIRYARLPNPGS